MDDFEIEWDARPDLRDPAFVEGLPGVGHVGKLAAEYLLEELDSQSVCRIYSTHFPPQVTVEDGVSDLVCAEVHAVETDERDLLVLVGDHQAQTPMGHYGLTEAILDVHDELDGGRIFALGGVPTGELIEEYDVIGAVTDDSQIEDLEDAGVEFPDDEPAGGIVGVSGLLLGLGERRDDTAACLMGETSGYLVDPKSARAVLEVLETVLDFEIDYESLESQAEEMEEVVRQMEELESANQAPTDEDLRYIG